jgi:hypothetical protein
MRHRKNETMPTKSPVKMEMVMRYSLDPGVTVTQEFNRNDLRSGLVRSELVKPPRQVIRRAKDAVEMCVVGKS